MIQDGTRLDRLLRRSYPSLPQNVIEKSLRDKKILINGARAKSNSRVGDNDTVEVLADFKIYAAPRSTRKTCEAAAGSLDRIGLLQSMIVYEDERLCVLNKPANIPVQGGTGVGLHIDGLLAEYGKTKDTVYRLVHRLDRDTTGVLVVAKTLETAQQLAKAFSSRDTKKVYWALVESRPAAVSGVCRDAMGKAWEQDREKMSVHAEDAKEAITRYKVLDSHAKVMSWVELIPETGRTHQLRVHMSQLGCPIWGDLKYGAHHSAPLMLHARSITLKLPAQRALTFTAEPADHMNRFLEKHFHKTLEKFCEHRPESH